MTKNLTKSSYTDPCPADILGEADTDPEGDADPDGDALFEALGDADGELDWLGVADGLWVALADPEGEADALGDNEGDDECEYPQIPSSTKAWPQVNVSTVLRISRLANIFAEPNMPFSA